MSRTEFASLKCVKTTGEGEGMEGMEGGGVGKEEYPGMVFGQTIF